MISVTPVFGVFFHRPGELRKSPDPSKGRDCDRQFPAVPPSSPGPLLHLSGEEETMCGCWRTLMAQGAGP